MTWRLMPVLALGATALVMSGCGTIANTVWLFPEEGGQRVYGGVRGDWEIAREAATNRSESGPNTLLWLPIADMPLSAVGDTVTLPVTVPLALWHSVRPATYARPYSSPSVSVSQPADVSAPCLPVHGKPEA